MLLVDTYNVLHTRSAHRALSDEPGPGELAVLIAAGRYRRDRAILICDGSPHPAHLGPSAERRAELRYKVEGVEIVYAGAGRDADSLIELYISHDSAPRRLKVVSSDRRLIRAARTVRAHSIDAEGFMQTLLGDAERAGQRWSRPRFATEVPLSRPAVRYWKDLFGIDEADLPPEAHQQAEPFPQAHDDTHRESPAAQPEQPKPTRRARPASDKPPLPPEPIDPLLLEALEEWRGRLSLDDLSMDQWLGDTPNPD